jgi:hypothetical protein
MSSTFVSRGVRRSDQGSLAMKEDGTHEPLEILDPGLALGLERGRQAGEREVWQELERRERGHRREQLLSAIRRDG